jgi:transposase InsO family protein
VDGSLLEDTKCGNIYAFCRKILKTLGENVTKKILTYNGTQFISKRWKTMVQGRRITPVFTAYKNPAAGGITERKVQSLKQKLRLLFFLEGVSNFRTATQMATRAIANTTTPATK